MPVTTNKGRLETSDITKRTVRAIRNGEPDTAHPGVGLIRFTHAGDVPRNDRGWCMGTLIADRVVPRAAHCIFDTERSDFFVTLSPRLLNNPLVDPSVAGDYLSGTPYADPRFGEGQVRADDAARSRSRPGTRCFQVARLGLEPGTPRFSGLRAEVSNTTKSLLRSWFGTRGAHGRDTRCLRTFRPGSGTRMPASTQWVVPP
jgi:hypothetical protein